jgi:hypothetical protein
MKAFFLIITLLFLSIQLDELFAQKDSTGFVYDSFFLSKKKGFLGRIGKSITADKPKPELTISGVVKNNLPYNRYSGLPIRNIYIISLELNQDINDTAKRKRNLIMNVANNLHKKSREAVIKKNLFFKEGDKLYPYLLADNERYLRELVYLQDAKITLTPVEFGNAVDVIVYTKDVFSIGGSVNVSGSNNFDAELKDENFLGNATKISVKALYDETRGPKLGYGGAFLQRNIAGTFVDFSAGFKTFNGAFNSGRPEETFTYLKLDKPLVSPYMAFTGTADLSWHKTANNYITDSIYKTEYNYAYVDFDGWYGCNLGTQKLLQKTIQKRIREFIALRVFHHEFQQVPGLYQNTYNYIYANITGVLGGINIFKQNFYKTTFIYGFGRQEDVPEGFSLSLTGGWTDKQGHSRPYTGFDFTRNYFGSKGNYYNYTFRVGGFLEDGKFEDINLLFNLDFFSRLKEIGGRCKLRKFTTLSITQQIRKILDQPLFLSSNFGLPEISNDNIAAQTRVTFKHESVFYSSWKLFGFRFAPFLFGNGCFLVPTAKNIFKGDFYSSLGAGLRTRNEALIFGTIEGRFNYFPRMNAGMESYRIDFKTDLRFKYNSQYIKRPDFVSPNG